MPTVLSYRTMGSTTAGGSKISSTDRPREEFQILQKMPKPMPPKQTITSARRFNNPAVGVLKSRLPDVNAEKRVYQSSGSEHEQEPSSVHLAAMVNEFIENYSGLSRNASVKDLRSNDSIKEDCLGGELLEILKGHLTCTSEAELSLLAEVPKAIDRIKHQSGRGVCREEDCSSGCLKRATMRILREAGYNAAICKSRWDHAGGFPGGDYEYIDVLIEKNHGVTERLIVEIDFRGQFDIARPTDRYTSIFQELPQVFVGTSERLQQVVNLMSNAVKQSLKKREMALPPWRKPDYMRAKWFSAYKRTTNDVITPHETTEAIVNRELARTAIRGSRWDSSRRFTAEFELQLGQPQQQQLQLDSISRQFGKAWTGTNYATTTSTNRSGNEITAMSTDWKPPPIVNCRKPARSAGLAAVLFEAGLSALAKQQHQQPNAKRSLVAVS